MEHEALALSDGSPEVTVADGEPVVRHGERSGCLFVLVSGELEVRHGDAVVGRLREAGSVVGETALLLGSAATADVLAVGDVVVRRIDDPEALFVDHPEFARLVASMLARRLLVVSSYLADLQEQFAGRDDVTGLIGGVLADLLGGGRRSTLEPGSERETDSPY